MSKTNHHKRKDYEEQYLRLYKEAFKVDYSERLNIIPDYRLLSLINGLLVHFKCVPFTTEELEMELS